MATWEDGPEYAPAQRPDAFRSPAAPPLDVAPPRPRPSADAPRALPVFRQDRPAPPLESLAPRGDDPRDPHQEFEVASSTLTEPDSAWGAVATHHAPQQVWSPPTGAPVVAAAPAPDPSFEMPHPDAVTGPPQADPHAPITLTGGRRREPGWEVPGSASAPFGAPPPQGWPAVGVTPPGEMVWAPPQPVMLTLASWWSAMRPITVAALLFGGILFPVSPFLFAVAAWSGWGVRQRSEWVRNMFLVGMGMLGVTGVLGLVMTGGELLTAWDVLGKVSLGVCWLTLGTVGVIVATSLAAGEQPERWA
ncbi:hypothetical protein GCM10027418_09980 [Mariniluteicoccus endophyticus]